MGQPFSRREFLKVRLQNNATLVCVIALTSLVTRALFLFRDGMPDPDSLMVAAGVALGVTGQLPFAETFLYGKQLNPGVFLFMRAAWPILWRDPHQVATILNWLSMVAGTLTLLPLYGLLRTYLPARTTLLCLIIWAFTPLVWEAQTCFHPLIPATFFLCMALSFGKRAYRRAQWWSLGGACILASAALLTRSEVVLVWPGLVLFALASERKRRATGILLSVTIFAIAVYATTLHILATGTAAESAGFGHFVTRYAQMYEMSFSPRGLPRSAAWAIMGLGIGTISACVIAIPKLLRRQAGQGRLPVIAAFVVGLPSLLYWLPYIVPILRHYYLTSIGLVLMLGYALAMLHTRKAIALTAALCLASLIVPEVAYRIYNRTHPVSMKTPHGAFFYHHEFAVRDVQELTSLRESSLTCGSLPDGKHGSIVVGRWDACANVMYGIASRGTNVTRVADEGIFPEVGYLHYRSDDHDLQVISFLYLDDAEVRRTVANVLDSTCSKGSCVFLPRSVRPFESLNNCPRVFLYGP